MNKIHFWYCCCAALAIVATACSYDRSPAFGNYDPNHPGYEYAPEGDMYHSAAYDPLSQYEDNSNPFNPDSMNMRLAAPGTVARGKSEFVFPYQNTEAEYERAGRELRSPYPATEANLTHGKRLYELYCYQCHGLEGKNDGPVMAAGKFPRPFWPAYDSEHVRGLQEGKIFFVITYGRNLMGPHGSILSPQQRWLITNYVKHLSDGGAPVPAQEPAQAPDSLRPVQPSTTVPTITSLRSE